jgi:hypothetical protein
MKDSAYVKIIIMVTQNVDFSDFEGTNCTVFCNNTACIESKSRNAYCNVNGVCSCGPSYYGNKCDIYCDENKNW